MPELAAGRRRPDPGTNRGDDGFAMVVSVVVASIAIVLVTIILASSVHLDSATVRERRWESALQVAEAGVEDAVTKLRTDLTYAGTTAATNAPGGQFEVKVTNLGGASRQIDAVSYVPSKAAANALKRRIRVVYEPEPSFKYALFSASSLFVNSGNGVIDGDVFGNEDVIVDNTSEVIGNVISAWGKVDVSNSAHVRKDTDGTGGGVIAGGFNSAATAADRWSVNINSNNASVDGDITIRVETVCNTSPGGTGAYGLRNAGPVGGTVHMPATATVLDPSVPRVDECVQRSAKTPLPRFTYDPQNYASVVEMSTTAFNAGGALPAGGAVYVKSDGTGPIDLSKRYATGDLVLISEPKIRQANSGYDFFPTSLPRTSLIQIVALDTSTDPSDPSFQVENKFDVNPNYAVDPPAPAVLVYSPGYCDFKNSTLSNGAVYCNGMNIKNGLEISYDGRIERLLGFGNAKLVRSSFVELPASTPLP